MKYLVLHPLTLAFFLFYSSLLVAENSSIEDLITFNGEFTEGSLLFGKTEPGSRILFQEKEIRITKNGEFIIGLHRDENKHSQLMLIMPNGNKLSKTVKIKQRKYKIQRINGLPKAKVSPRGKELMKRIQNEIALAKKARKRVDERLDFLQNFIWPVTGRISGVYGSQRILNGKPRRPHFGVDIARPTGTPVVAPTDGLITLAHPDMFFSGGTIILDHGHGLSSSFLHLSKLHVTVDQRVKQGDIIGEVGATGRVTGPHLDWRMNWLDKRIDPQNLVPPMGQVLNMNKSL